MIPRPIFKLAVLPIWLLVSIGSFWLWAVLSNQLKPYYLGWPSKFLYERLWLPSMPRMPGTKPEPEKWSVLAFSCPPPSKSLCLAGPGDTRHGAPLFIYDYEAPREVVRALLANKIFHGSALTALWFPAGMTVFSLPLLFTAAFILDFRRRRRLLHGVQIEGRWPVPVTAFTDLLERLHSGSVRINVEKVRGRSSSLK
jgi:hypothetical protein